MTVKFAHNNKYLERTLMFLFLSAIFFSCSTATALAQAGASPEIASISPSPVQAGQRISILGTGFRNFNTIYYAKDGQIATSTGSSIFGTDIVTYVPSNLLSGTYQVSVLPSGSSQTNAVSLSVIGVSPTVTPTPTSSPSPSPSPSSSPQPTPTNEVNIDTISPTQAQPGDRVVLDGRGFGNYNLISLSSEFFSVNTSASSLTGRDLMFYLPLNTVSGLYRVTVSTRGFTSNAVNLMVVGGPSPTPTVSPSPTPPPPGEVVITDVDPKPGIAGSRASISGRGFASFNTITFTEGTKVFRTGGFSLDGMRINLFIPHNMPAGTYQTTVTASGKVSNSVNWTIEAAGDCTIGIICPKDAQYTAVGDSIAVGLVAFRGYVPRYRDFIAQDNQITVDLDNLGRSGWRSGQLAQALQTDQLLRSNLSSADYITWNIGGNDLRDARDKYRLKTCGGTDNQDCLRQAVADFKQNWNKIMAEIIRLRKNNGVVVRTMDIYYPYVNEDKAADSWPGDGGTNDYQELKPYLIEVNRHISLATSQQNVRYARVSLYFNGCTLDQDPDDRGLISADGFHPNETGHQTIANALRQLGYNNPIPVPDPKIIYSPEVQTPDADNAPTAPIRC